MAELPDVMQLAESGKAEDLHDYLRKKADASLYFFTKVVLGYKDLVDHFHLPFCERVQSEQPRKRGFLLPRSTFKSTTGSKSYPLWRIAKDPNYRILTVGESPDVAAKSLKDIKWHVLNNQLFRWLYPELIPPNINDTKWTDTEILLPRSESFDESTFTCWGVDKRMTGFHFDEIIYDDPIGFEASQSKAVMNKAIDWVKAASGLLVDPDHSRESFYGTRWKDGTEDLYGWAMVNDPRIEWYVRSAIEDGKPTFPEKLNFDVLADIRKRSGDYLYFCQYMNDPIAPEGSDFPPDCLRWYDIGDDNKTLIPTDGTPPVKLAGLVRMSMYDVSSGGKAAKAENALIIAGMSADKRIFVLDAWSRNCGAGEAVEKDLQLKDKFHTTDDWYEQNGVGKPVEDIAKLRNAEDICLACAKKHSRLVLKPIRRGSQNKEDRIRLDSQGYVDTGRVYLRNGMETLRRQIITFPHGSPIDQFDALSTLLHKLYPPLTDEQVEEEREQVERVKNLAHNPRTNTGRDYGGYV